ncbi:hypothetical protein F2Q68_00026839, partial [Brassica cretica]
GDFRIPKFKIEFGFEASKVFGDWKHEMSLYQKACVEIDEEGTEAVAVSARVESIPLERVIVGDFRIPKFKIEFGFEASKVFVDWKHEMSLYQKACVEIDEEGTEAVAVSARVGYCTSNGIVPKMIDFVADHPFLFLIREDKTGTVLFVGQIFNTFKCSPA